MPLPELDFDVTVTVLAVAANGRPIAEALEDDAETAIAPAFVVTIEAATEELTRINLDLWWAAPLRAAETGLVAPELPAQWVTFWRRQWSAVERRVGFLPFLHRGHFVGEVRVWPGASCFIRSAPRGADQPWEIGGESPLSFALADDDTGVVLLRSGVNRERAGQALLAGQRTNPEQFFNCPINADEKTVIERTHARSGWLFLILEAGRVLAVCDLVVEEPGVG